jgi:hypothetical protein
MKNIIFCTTVNLETLEHCSGHKPSDDTEIHILLNKIPNWAFKR